MPLSNCFDPDPRVYQEALSLVKSGYDVTILAWDREFKRPPYEEIDGINVERIYVRSTHGRGTTQIFFLALFWLKAFYRAMKKDFNVIHCHDFDTLPLGFLIGKLRGKKIVYDAHESFADMLTGSVPSWLTKAIALVEMALVKRIDLLITIGETLRNDFQRRGAKHTCVVANYKNPDDFKFPESLLADEKKKFGIPSDKLVITYLAWLSKERKVISLMQAVKQLSDVFLLIGGDGPLKDWVQKEAAASKNIIYLGFVNPKDVPLYTALADFIFYGFDKTNPNSKYSAPNKLFEALAAGKAIITGDFGEIGRIVREEQCGVVLSENGSKGIKKALRDYLRRDNLDEYKRRSQAIGQSKFNWKRAEEVLLTRYESLFQDG